MARWVQFIGGRMRWVELGEPLGPEPEPAREKIAPRAGNRRRATATYRAASDGTATRSQTSHQQTGAEVLAADRALREGAKWRARVEPRVDEFPALAAFWEVPPCRDTPCTCGRWIVLLARERAERRRLDQLADRVPIAPPVIAPRLGRAASDVEV